MFVPAPGDTQEGGLTDWQRRYMLIMMIFANGNPKTNTDYMYLDTNNCGILQESGEEPDYDQVPLPCPPLASCPQPRQPSLGWEAGEESDHQHQHLQVSCDWPRPVT